jgi:hypothetical protein
MIGSNIGEIKKIVLVSIVLVILLLSAVILNTQKRLSLVQMKAATEKKAQPSVIPSPTLFETPGLYSINLTPVSVRIGETVSAEINFFAQDKVLDGSDVVLKFDPLFLIADKNIIKGDYFNIYPIVKVDNEKGEIRVSGFDAKKKSGMVNPVTLFNVKFTTQKQGNTTVSFDFVKGKTNKTTLIESKTSRNILGQAGPVVVAIE